MLNQTALTDTSGVRRRVAVVAPGLEILGGQGVQAAALMRELANEGFEVSFIPLNQSFPRGMQWIKTIPYLRTCVNQLVYRRALRAIRDVDVLLLFSASYWSFLLSQVPAIHASRRYGVPVLLNYHSGEADDHLTNWGRWVHPWLRNVSHIVVPSLYLQQVFAKHGYDARVIPNIIDLKQFSYRRRQPLRNRLLSVRNLESIYRVDNTLEAFSIIKQKIPDASLTIVGYGSQENRLKQLVADRKIADVTFAGRVEPAQMAAIYDKSDIFINSSVVDNQPVSLLEAFAAGVPVISTDTGDIKHMVRQGKTGLLVEKNHPMGIANAVFWLIAHPQQATDMTDAAQADVSQYTWPNVRQKWITLLDGRTS